MTAERYTVVFTGLFDVKKPGEYPYLTMAEEPDDSHTLSRGRPPYEKLGREIGFLDLPEECRHLALDVYLGLWDL